MNYPNGMKRASFQTLANAPKKNKIDYANRGMTLEEDINSTNEYYLATNKAIIHKKPTPIQIVDVHYPKRSAAVIKEAYFQAKSTTDYNGIYRGKHIDFEAKETKNKTLFPLTNIHDHQYEHMQAILDHGGICFMIIRFTALNATYLLLANDVLTYWRQMQKGGRKSIPHTFFEENGYLIPFKLQARVDYLSVIDQVYFA